MDEHEPAIDTVTPALQPMVHVKDMPAAVAFYERLGARMVNGSRDGDWVVVLSLGAAQIGLLAHPPTPSRTKASSSSTSNPKHRWPNSNSTWWQAG